MLSVWRSVAPGQKSNPNPFLAPMAVWEIRLPDGALKGVETPSSGCVVRCKAPSHIPVRDRAPRKQARCISGYVMLAHQAWFCRSTLTQSTFVLCRRNVPRGSLKVAQGGCTEALLPHLPPDFGHAVNAEGFLGYLLDLWSGFHITSTAIRE